MRLYGGGYIYRANRHGSLMNTLNLKKLLDLITIYKDWTEFVKENNCSDGFRETLLNEAYKRTYWAFISAINSLKAKDYKTFVNYLVENRFLVKKWNQYSKSAFLDNAVFVVSENNPYLGYGLYKIHVIPRKIVLKVFKLLKIRK